MKSVRVLSVLGLFRPAFSGEGEWWLRMIPHLRRRGVEVSVLSSRCSGEKELPASELVENVQIYRVGAPGARRPYWSFLCGVMSFLILRRRMFDVVTFHGTSGDTLFLSCLIGKIFGWKTVYRMTLFPWAGPLAIKEGGKFGWLRVRLLSLGDGFISLSGPLTRSCIEAGLPIEKLLTVGQGVETSKFEVTKERRERARTELGIPHDCRVVLFVGTLRYLKGVDILVEAWRRLIVSVDNALLFLVGPNAESGLEPANQQFGETIAETIQSSEFRDTVKLVGYTPHVDRYYAAADVFVLPSRWEGFPNVMLEAMASSLPCVVSALDGLTAEVLVNDREGVIVTSPDPEEYASQISRLLKDKELSAEMGRLARARVLEQFTMERVADAHAAFLHKIAGR